MILNDDCVRHWRRAALLAGAASLLVPAPALSLQTRPPEFWQQDRWVNHERSQMQSDFSLAEKIFESDRFNCGRKAVGDMEALVRKAQAFADSAVGPQAPYARNIAADFRARLERWRLKMEECERSGRHRIGENPGAPKPQPPPPQSGPVGQPTLTSPRTHSGDLMGMKGGDIDSVDRDLRRLGSYARSNQCALFWSEVARLRELGLDYEQAHELEQLIKQGCPPGVTSPPQASPQAQGPAANEAESFLDEMEPTKDLFGQEWVEPLPPAPAVKLDPQSASFLDFHNRERALVGVPPLTWDHALAAGARAYAIQLTSAGRLVHSSREGRKHIRENLLQSLPGQSPEAMIGVWIAEKRYFRPGVFPDVSSTGNWYDIGHYTQMIWETTTNVGCATHGDARSTWLVCHYSPPGNRDGTFIGGPPPP